MNDAPQAALSLDTIHFWNDAAAYALAAFVLWALRRRGTRFGVRRAGVALAAAVVVVAWTWPAGLGRVQPGARGVVLRFGAPTGRLLGEGLYFVTPLAERVVQVNTQINTVRLDRAQGVCRDLEPVFGDLAVTFHVDPARAVDVYRTLRFAYVSRIVEPAAKDAWKATSARYAAGEIVARRPDVQRDLRREIAVRLAPFGLVLDTVATERLNFSYAYAQAAQAKVVMVQRTLEAQEDLRRVRFNAQQSVVRAKSEVDALRLQRNIPLAQLVRLRELELQRRAIDKWDGRLPATAADLPFLGRELTPHRD